MEADELRKLLKEAGLDLERGQADDVLPALDWGAAATTEGEETEVREALKSAQRAAGEDELPTNTAIYFRDISSVTLLTAEEEIQLAQGIENGEDAKRVLQHHPQLSEERLDQLDHLVRDGERARARLTEANLRLVVSVARKYLNRGLPMLDLIQEGNIGLARAVEKYDWRKGYRFSTYAYWWIRQGMTRALAEQSRPIRVPTHMVSAIGDVYKAFRDLQQDLGREPAVSEVASYLSLSVDKVREILRSTRQPISLETPLNDEGSSTLGDLIADRDLNTPHDAAAHSLLRRHMEDAMQVLTTREQQVLRMRYGLDDGRDHTLGEIADVLGVTSERVRQIEGAALSKLRQPNLRHKLREYLDEYVA